MSRIPLYSVLGIAGRSRLIGISYIEEIRIRVDVPVGVGVSVAVEEAVGVDVDVGVNVAVGIGVSAATVGSGLVGCGGAVTTTTMGDDGGCVAARVSAGSIVGIVGFEVLVGAGMMVAGSAGRDVAV